MVLSTVGNIGTKLVVDFEKYKPAIDNTLKNEGELTAAKRLINRVSKEHKNFVDVIVYDVLACNSEWINACIKSGIDTVVRVKKNNVKSIRETKYRVNKSEPVANWKAHDGYESIEVYEHYF